MYSETNVTFGQLYPRAPRTAEDWHRIRVAVWERIAKQHGHIIVGDMIHVLAAVESEMKQAPSGPPRALALEPPA